MIDAKKKVVFPQSNIKTIKLGEQDVQVESYISDIIQRELVKIYLQELFSEETDDFDYRLLNAENALLLSILELLTDIQLVDESNGKKTALFDLNNLFSNTRFIKTLLGSIENYDDFRSNLYRTVEARIEQKRLDSSLGNKLETLYDKVVNFIESLSDLSPEKVESIKSLLKEVESSEILKSLSGKV